jgi:WD40 repeat protein
VYATTSGERLFAVAGQTYHPFFSFSNDSQSLAYFARDERRTSLSLFDLERREQVTEIDGDCWGAAFSPDGKVLAATKAKPESDATNPAVEVLLIELPTGKQRAVEARLRSISNLLFSEGGRKLIGLDCPSPRSQIDSLTEMNLAEETSKIVSFDPLKAEATVDTWAPWARPSVTVNQFSPTTLERSRVYDILRGEWCAEFDDGPAFDLARITLDGRFLAWPCHVEKGEDRLGDWLKRKFAPSGNEPVRNTRALRIIDLEMGRTVLLVAGTDEFRFSADGRTLVTWTWDREARVWDLPPRRPIFLLALLAAAPTLLFTVLLWWRLGRA